MNTLDELLKEWEFDCNIDKTEPGHELIKIPKMHSKYLSVLVKNKLLLKKAKDEYNEERKIRYNYYSGNYNTDPQKLQELGLGPFKLILKNDISTYIETDPAILKLTNKIAYYEEMIEACTLIFAELKNRGFNMNAVISWEKFVSGA